MNRKKKCNRACLIFCQLYLIVERGSYYPFVNYILPQLYATQFQCACELWFKLVLPGYVVSSLVAGLHTVCSLVGSLL